MFAVVKTGGKQYRVEKQSIIKVEKLVAEVGTIVTLDSVLMVANGDKQTIGAPYVKGASVKAEVLAQDRGPKILIFKKKRRQNYRRKKGHRQNITTLKITAINGPKAKS